MAEVKVAPRSTTDGAKGKEVEVPRGTRPEVPSAWQGSPFGFVRRFAEEMERIFDDFGFRGMPGMIAAGREVPGRGLAGIPADWAPRIEIHREEGRTVVRADLPGLNKEDIRVEVDEDQLTIQGERKSERKEEREGRSYTECSYGRFYRGIPLPPGVDASKVTAEFKNGVLEIVVPTPAPPPSRSKRVEVQEKH